MNRMVKFFIIANFSGFIAMVSVNVFAHFSASPTNNLNELTEATSQYIHYNFASIELLIEQEVGRIVLTQVYKNIGLNITISPLPGKRAQYAANSGNKDGEIMRIWTYGDETPNSIRVPTPYYYLETMPFVLKNSEIVIETKEALANYRLTKIRGVKHTNNITHGLTNIYEMSSTEDMFKLLESGRVDVVLTNTIDGNLALTRLGLDNITSMNKPLALLPLYHYIHKKHQNLIPLIDKEIKRLNGNGELAQLIFLAEQDVIKLNQ